MRIDALAVKDFPPFADLEVEFPSKSQGSRLAEVHILTGQNGTGKTRLLSLLAASLGYQAELAARIAGSKSVGGVRSNWQNRTYIWVLNSRAGLVPVGQTLNFPACITSPHRIVFERHLNSLMLNLDERASLNLGEFAAMAFRGVANISDAEVTALSPIEVKDSAALLAFNKAADDSKQVAQSLVNIKMAAAMDTLDDNLSIPTRATRLSDRLEEAVTQITGHRFRFSVTPYPKVSLKVTWGTTSMRFNQLPDGLRCIIGWLAACVAKLDALYPEHANPLEIPLVLLLDEPEGHLHPAWQQKLIPAAQALFPNGQFFVATHSPFVISSVNEGWIHVLRADPDGVVKFEKPRACGKGDSYVEIVEEVLGVKGWYDPETEALLKAFRDLKNAVLNGEADREAELREQAKAIAGRGDTLGDMIGGEMLQFERLKAQSATPA